MSKAEANLIAGIFHREELHIEALRKHLRDEGRDKANLQIWKRRAILALYFYIELETPSYRSILKRMPQEELILSGDLIFTLLEFSFNGSICEVFIK